MPKALHILRNHESMLSQMHGSGKNIITCASIPAGPLRRCTHPGKMFSLLHISRRISA